MVLDTATLQKAFEEMIPFNKLLGVKIEDADLERNRVVSRLTLRPEFIGNFIEGFPHGGVISFLIDATAGAAAALSLDDVGLFARLATIDMRVDYLKPARGRVLFTSSEVMRSGNRVIVVRSDVHDDEGTLVALGSNAFNVSR